MKYMLDTNICIYIIKKKPLKVLQFFNTLDMGEVCISSITLAELQYGVEKSEHHEKNRIALIGFLNPLDILQFTDTAAIVYGKIRAELEKKGQIIGAYDLLIAAHAISQNLTLVTNNIQEFCRIPNLALENWAD